MAEQRRWISVALFTTLGLVAAFGVSAVAGLWDDEPTDTGLRVLGPGIDRAGEVRVEVLNGAGVTGLARDATHQLRGRGFDVVFFGNADHFRHERSVVVDRVGDLDRARAVAGALGIDSVTSAVDSSLMLEVSVVLGDDWPPPRQEPRSLVDRIRGLIAPRDSAGAAADTAADGAGS